jgi:hypothetical protein
MALPNFSGVWELSLEKSQLKQALPRRITVRIEHAANTIHQVVMVVSASGQEQTNSFRFSTTGSTSPIAFGGNTGETSARWDGSTLIVESTLAVGDRVLHFRDHWSLSSGGTVLTMSHPDDDLAGQVSVLERAAS